MARKVYGLWYWYRSRENGYPGILRYGKDFGEYLIRGAFISLYLVFAATIVAALFLHATSAALVGAFVSGMVDCSADHLTHAVVLAYAHAGTCNEVHQGKEGYDQALHEEAKVK
jgi:hypothetical protein